MIIEKLLSKRGQISMELGILVAAAVAVAAIAAYFYISNVQKSAEKAGKAGNKTVDELNKTADHYIKKIKDLTS
ncbi:class III signal peptide-containing protein [Methanothermococcus sp. SCGC AD-155-N22]|nr:class III signal peptide-containing protein [Methanothermococcus sp. SCGC AD-155-N22]